MVILIVKNIDITKYKFKFNVLGGEPTLHPELSTIIFELLTNKK